MTLVRVGWQEDDDAAACARVRESSLHGVVERMVWWSKYAPVSYLGWTLSAGQSAFDEFDGKLFDPLINAGGLCFRDRFAVRAPRARGSLQRSGDFR